MPTTDTSIPSYRKPADRRTENAGFRVYRDQKAALLDKFPDKTSAIVRALIDKFLRSEAMQNDVLLAIDKQNQ